MRTHNEIVVAAAVEDCFVAAREVERWPAILPHYREVRFVDPGRTRVLMRAVREFGPLPYPIWWESRMEVDDDEHAIRYRHLRGITTGMDVEWRLDPLEGGTRIVIVHEWNGPGWPLIGGIAARRVIGPRFVHVVADRTLAGIRRAVESARGTRGAAGEAAAEARGTVPAPAERGP